ncbi:GNAT family N-acetyltransferase [candidate division WWE3 bacterium]|uniref:GNAT family N-acetyltransferase n=1 Tax=candidate division WWE3 bacterium TaxID=2053526 RepID=A0A7X9DK41_UNCKA|nr:GNAT family N-acetyltransferase [candidate division WWE3 bacterium]
MDTVIIREARLEDLDKVFALVNELENFSLDKKQFTSTYKANLGNPSISYLVATFDMEVVGFVGLYISGLLHHAGKVAQIQELVVNPKFRSQGIGKKLFLEAEKIAKQNCGLIELTSNINRERAHKFYTDKMGMKMTSYKFIKLL